MKIDQRFRNHFSVVITNTIPTVIGIWLVLNLDLLGEAEDVGGIGASIGWTSLIVAGVAVLYVIFSLINWAKTYFTVTEDMLIVERNTLIKRKNTIALKNISNVNLEQGLLSMLFDTCRVKLDTNTLSTANETDVTIVLKRQDAEELRQLLLCGAENSDDDEQPAKNVEFDEGKSFEVNTRDIIANGFFSLSFSVVIIFLGAAAFGISMLSEALKDPEMGMGDAISVFLSLAVFAVGLIWSMAKKFIDYVDFRVERAEDKVYLSYGLLKKVTYSIPVSKINAILVKQTLLARIGGRYMVEIVNVGMGDDDHEARTFFLPYSKMERIEDLLSRLLPEFDGCIEMEEERQSPSIWLVYLPKVFIYLAFSASVTALVYELWRDYAIIPLIGFAAIGAFLLIVKIAVYYTRSVSLGEKMISVADGAFSKKRLFVGYGKIQYIESSRGPIAKRCKIAKGSLHLLASAANQTWRIPYTKEENIEYIKNKLIG